VPVLGQVEANLGAIDRAALRGAATGIGLTPRVSPGAILASSLRDEIRDDALILVIEEGVLERSKEVRG